MSALPLGGAVARERLADAEDDAGAIVPEVDWARVDATTDEEIAAQIAEDEAEARRDAAAHVRRVRRKVGLSQVAFARRIGVPVDTACNWEQGKRSPRGPACALLRIIDRAPEVALQAWAGIDTDPWSAGRDFPARYR